VPPSPKPKFLGKYYSISKHSIEALVNNYLYASEPEDFNDPFDSQHFLMDYSLITPEYYREFLKLRQIKFEELMADFDNDVSRTLQAIIDTSYKLFLGEHGIVCMTERNDDEFMWGMYTNNRGFFVEYAYNDFPEKFHGPFPMIYHEQIGRIDASKFDGLEAFLLRIMHKKSIWSNEREWRFVVYNDGIPFKNKHYWRNEHHFDKVQDRYVHYPANCVKAVYLGCNFHDNRYTELAGTFTGDDKLLRSQLLTFLIERNIKTYLFALDTENLKLHPRLIQYKKETEFVFSFEFL
jgi:hypothetical protein